jgi:hypothetical protein
LDLIILTTKIQLDFVNKLRAELSARRWSLDICDLDLGFVQKLIRIFPWEKSVVPLRQYSVLDQ